MKYSYRFIETFITSMAENGPSDEVFDCSIERRVHFTMFTDVFSEHALSSYHFTRQVAGFMLTSMDKVANELLVTAKPGGFSQPSIVYT